MIDERTLAILATILSSINAIAMILLAWKKLGPDLLKTQAESDKLHAEAGESNVAGAKISGEMLMDRISELRVELGKEREARMKDKQYFRRRIYELDLELKDTRDWARRLSGQVVKLGETPVPFIPTITGDDMPEPEE